MVIAQSGGPSMVINQSLVGAVLEARKSERIGKILGARHGIVGILSNDYIDLKKPSVKKLEAIAETPSSALGSCRRKPDAAARQQRHPRASSGKGLGTGTTDAGRGAANHYCPGCRWAHCASSAEEPLSVGNPASATADSCKRLPP